MSKSKSAYSTPEKVGKFDTHIIVVWVDNEAGVLFELLVYFLTYTILSPSCCGD